MVADCSIVHNFAILSWIDVLVDRLGGSLLLAHGVAGITDDEPSELLRWKKRYEEKMLAAPAGSGAYVRFLNGSIAIEDLIRRCQRGEIEVTVLNAEETAAAGSWLRPSRELRERCGIKAQLLGSGECASIAVAVNRALGFATDDLDAVRLYRCLGGRVHIFTLDVLKSAVRDGLLSEAQARQGYERLRTDYGFRGPDW